MKSRKNNVHVETVGGCYDTYILGAETMPDNDLLAAVRADQASEIETIIGRPQYTLGI